LLQGAWTENDSINAAFLIEGDSIFFPEQQPFKYNVSNDSIIIEYKLDIDYYEAIKWKILKIDRDSLIFMDKYRITRLKKRNG